MANNTSITMPSLRAKPTIQSASDRIPDVKVISPKIFPDSRGYFCESFNSQEWKELLCFDVVFKQDNVTMSTANVLRGFHAQPGMGKLVTCLTGKILDVVVDVRPESATFGEHVTRELNDVTKEHLWIPDGFLHGFLVLSPIALVAYKCSSTYNSALEYGVDPFDADIGVKWPVEREVMVLSDKDGKHPTLKSLKL